METMIARKVFISADEIIATKQQFFWPNVAKSRNAIKIRRLCPQEPEGETRVCEHLSVTVGKAWVGALIVAISWKGMTVHLMCYSDVVILITPSELTELNRRNGNNDCEKSIYFCGRNNRNKTAVLLAKCSEESECDQNQTSLSSRTRRRNSCLRALKCHCRQGMGRGPHCGNQLEGDDCPPNVLFRCRYTNNAVRARDACPDGCNDGKCINAVDINDNTSESGGDGETDTEP
ncbi:unnamed protein product [Oppiella nova]|uniref:Uncharacterized protein n=1 Tax=Oppiella nova TaxID=334625 RepID=A0A7R9QY79_9ACAR|nr:unnamed protein product [Oppiella nova]CAG2179318.1 unnamed protein product [Oppiella nova]